MRRAFYPFFQSLSWTTVGGFLDILRAALPEVNPSRTRGDSFHPKVGGVRRLLPHAVPQRDLSLRKSQGAGGSCPCGSWCKIFRYVDDYLAVNPSSGSDNSVHHDFTKNDMGLSATKEDISKEGLQCFYLRLTPSSHGLRLSFQQHSQKPVIAFSSYQSKAWKSGIVKFLHSSSCRKSCSHLIRKGLSVQVTQNQKAGQLAILIENIKRLTAQQKKIPREPPSVSLSRRPARIPYTHTTLHID